MFISKFKSISIIFKIINKFKRKKIYLILINQKIYFKRNNQICSALKDQLKEIGLGKISLEGENDVYARSTEEVRFVLKKYQEQYKIKLNRSNYSIVKFNI